MRGDDVESHRHVRTSSNHQSDHSASDHCNRGSYDSVWLIGGEWLIGGGVVNRRGCGYNA